MDLLIVLIAFIVPYLPDHNLHVNHIGEIAAKAILLLFGCEVFTGELRGNAKKMAAMAITALLIVGVKGLL